MPREQAMMPHSYQLWQIERTKSPAEQRAADARASEVAAGMSRSFRQFGRLMRALTARQSRLGRSARQVSGPAPAYARASPEVPADRSAACPAAMQPSATPDARRYSSV